MVPSLLVVCISSLGAAGEGIVYIILQDELMTYFGAKFNDRDKKVVFFTFYCSMITMHRKETASREMSLNWLKL
jgi:hypothetical protein